MLDGGLLVVDDTPDSLRVLVEMLQQRGYRIRSATNGNRALASARKAAPDLILLDVCMPDMDGFEVCRALKSELPGVPVIFISALDETADKLRAFEQGGVDYITK
ncbi:response regulator, partial [bacterium]|nr:response regulator [bacterium]